MEKAAPQDVFRALTKDKKFRNAEEDKLISDYTLQLAFFKKYTDSGLKNIPMECTKVLKPLHMKKGEIVFNINSEGTRFYIVIEGQVGLYARKMEEGNIENVHNLALVKVLSDGDYFGELGLLNYKTRSVTVQCHSDCCFAVIEKMDFDEILKKEELQLLQERVNLFASQNQLLKYSSKHTVKMLYLNAIFKTYSSNEIIFHTGSQLDAIFIIKSGQFKIMKEYRQSDEISESQEESEDEEDQNSLNEVTQKPQETLQIQAERLPKTTNKILTTATTKKPSINHHELGGFEEKQESSMVTPGNEEKALQRCKEKKKLIPILDLGSGQMFGYEDFVSRRSTYSYTVKCCEMGDVIMIRGYHFRKWLMADKLTMAYLLEQMAQQIAFIEEREKDIQKSITGYSHFYFETEKTSLQTLQDKINKRQVQENKQNNINTVGDNHSVKQDKKQHSQLRQMLQLDSKNNEKKKQLQPGGSASVKNIAENSRYVKKKEPTIRSESNVELNWENGGYEQLAKSEFAMENSDPKKKSQPRAKLSAYHDKLSQDFQSILSKNYIERFGADEVERLKDHVPQEIVQAISRKMKLKIPMQNICKSPPKMSSSVGDYFHIKAFTPMNPGSSNKNSMMNISFQSIQLPSPSAVSSPINIKKANFQSRRPQTATNAKRGAHSQGHTSWSHFKLHPSSSQTSSPMKTPQARKSQEKIGSQFISNSPETFPMKTSNDGNMTSSCLTPVSYQIQTIPEDNFDEFTSGKLQRKTPKHSLFSMTCQQIPSFEQAAGISSVAQTQPDNQKTNQITFGDEKNDSFEIKDQQIIMTTEGEEDEQDLEMQNKLNQETSDRQIMVIEEEQKDSNQENNNNNNNNNNKVVVYSTPKNQQVNEDPDQIQRAEISIAKNESKTLETNTSYYSQRLSPKNTAAASKQQQDVMQMLKASQQSSATNSPIRQNKTKQPSSSYSSLFRPYTPKVNRASASNIQPIIQSQQDYQLYQEMNLNSTTQQNLNKNHNNDPLSLQQQNQQLQHQSEYQYFLSNQSSSKHIVSTHNIRNYQDEISSNCAQEEEEEIVSPVLLNTYSSPSLTLQPQLSKNNHKNLNHQSSTFSINNSKKPSNPNNATSSKTNNSFFPPENFDLSQELNDMLASFSGVQKPKETKNLITYKGSTGRKLTIKEKELTYKFQDMNKSHQQLNQQQQALKGLQNNLSSSGGMFSASTAINNGSAMFTSSAMNDNKLISGLTMMGSTGSNKGSNNATFTSKSEPYLNAILRTQTSVGFDDRFTASMSSSLGFKQKAPVLLVPRQTVLLHQRPSSSGNLLSQNSLGSSYINNNAANQHEQIGVEPLGGYNPKTRAKTTASNSQVNNIITSSTGNLSNPIKRRPLSAKPIDFLKRLLDKRKSEHTVSTTIASAMKSQS